MQRVAQVPAGAVTYHKNGPWVNVQLPGTVAAQPFQYAAAVIVQRRIWVLRQQSVIHRYHRHTELFYKQLPPLVIGAQGAAYKGTAVDKIQARAARRTLGTVVHANGNGITVRCRYGAVPHFNLCLYAFGVGNTVTPGTESGQDLRRYRDLDPVQNEIWHQPRGPRHFAHGPAQQPRVNPIWRTGVRCIFGDVGQIAVHFHRRRGL